MVKDRHLHGPEEILRAIQEVWSHFTFEDFKNVFKSWTEQRTWVIANNGGLSLKRLAWKVIEFEDFEIDPGVMYCLATPYLPER
jgi:hypothetical protein